MRSINISANGEINKETWQDYETELLCTTLGICPICQDPHTLDYFRHALVLYKKDCLTKKEIEEKQEVLENKIESLLDAFNIETGIRAKEVVVWKKMSKKEPSQIIFKKVVIGHFAMWAVRQSPYLIPENLDKGVKEFNKHLISNSKVGNEDLVEATYTDLMKNIKDAISKSGTILSWNVAKMGSGSVFVSRYSKPKSDYDFVDLDALARNIAQSVWREQKDVTNPYLIM